MIDVDENELDSVVDEFNYWRKTIDQATGPDSKKKGEYFLNCYKDIEKDWKNIDKLEQADFKELIEVTFYNLENVWNGESYPYPPKRFARLMKIFT